MHKKSNVRIKYNNDVKNRLNAHWDEIEGDRAQQKQQQHTQEQSKSVYTHSMRAMHGCTNVV